MELILVRHGETEGNRKGTYIGCTDISLNEEGLKQAALLRDKLKDEHIARILCSPLKRASETAEIINQAHYLDIEYSDSLIERNFGIWESLTWEEIKNKYPDEYELWNKDWKEYCIEGGESARAAYLRAVSFVESLIAQNSHEALLLVTHAGCIKAIVAHLLGLGLEGTWHLKIDNGRITRIVINDEGYAYLTLLNG